MTTDTAKKHTPTRAVIYTRLSLDRKEGAGLERQEQAARNLAEAHGWEVTHVYVDQSVSAYSGVTRPGYEDMLAAVRARAVDVVICWDTDRLSRRLKDLISYMEVTTANHVETWAVTTGKWDLDSASGRMLAQIVGAVAEQESSHRAERVRAAMEQIAYKGLPYTAGRRTYGYERDHMTIVEREAGHLRSAAQRILGGASLRAIVQDMNAAGERTTAGKEFTSWSLKSLLINPRLAGLATWNGADADGKRLVKNRKIVGKAQWPGIFDEDTFYAVQAVLTDEKRRTNHKGNQPSQLGSSLYRCDHCGAVMFNRWRVYKNGGGRVRIYYVKEGKGHAARRGDQVDDYVAAAVIARLESLDIGRYLADTAGDPDHAGELAEDRDQLRQRMEAVEQMFNSGDVTPEQFKRMNRDLLSRLEDVEAQIEAVSDHGNPLAQLRDVTDMTAWWATAELAVRREVLAALVTVYVKPGAKSGRSFEPEFLRLEWKV